MNCIPLILALPFHHFHSLPSPLHPLTLCITSPPLPLHPISINPLSLPPQLIHFLPPPPSPTPSPPPAYHSQCTSSWHDGSLVNGE